jgi:hypothetical protein
MPAPGPLVIEQIWGSPSRALARCFHRTHPTRPLVPMATVELQSHQAEGSGGIPVPATRRFRFFTRCARMIVIAQSCRLHPLRKGLGSVPQPLATATNPRAQRGTRPRLSSARPHARNGTTATKAQPGTKRCTGLTILCSGPVNSARTAAELSRGGLAASRRCRSLTRRTPKPLARVASADFLQLCNARTLC